MKWNVMNHRANAFFKITVPGLVVGMVFAPVACAQALDDIVKSDTPLVLQDQGSFYVGGETVQQSFVERGSFGHKAPEHLTVNQMYVEYMVPEKDTEVPVVMVHGMGLSGKTYETTPDGRMGWDEYFVRHGYPVYVPDQVGRARSGFNQAIFNRVDAGLVQPSDQPQLLRFSDELGWPNFRFGRKVNKPYPHEKFPVEALGELAKQNVPDMNLTLPEPNPTYKALADLAVQIDGTVLLTHSQSGLFGVEAALVNNAGIKGLLLVEPGSCALTEATDAQIKMLAKIPTLVVYGDHLGDVPTGVPGFSWQTAYESCQAFISQVNKAGGNAKMLYLPEAGIPGNSHMIMQDTNSLEIADLMMKWLDENVDTN